MVTNYRTAPEAKRIANIIAGLANEGRTWQDIYRITKVSFDIYAPGTLSADQKETILYLGNVRNKEDVIVTRLSSKSKWEVSIEHTHVSNMRNKSQRSVQGTSKVLNQYKSLKTAENDAEKITVLANEGMDWNKIIYTLDIPMAIFPPRVLWEGQEDEVIFIGKIANKSEVLIVKDEHSKKWIVHIA